MSVISLVYNFATHDEALAFLQRNGAPASSGATVSPGVSSTSEVKATEATKPGRKKAEPAAKSFGPVVEGDPEGTRYFWKEGNNTAWKWTPADGGQPPVIADSVEISGVEYVAKKAMLAEKFKHLQESKSAEPAPAASPASAPTGDAGGPSDGEFDPFAEAVEEPAEPTDVPESELMAQLLALSKKPEGRAKLTQVLTKFGDGKSVPLMLKGADAAKRVAISKLATSLMG